MGATQEALLLNIQALDKLIDIISRVLDSKDVSNQEAAQAKAEAAALVATDKENEQLAAQVTAKLEQLISLASAAIPAPLQVVDAFDVEE